MGCGRRLHQKYAVSGPLEVYDSYLYCKIFISLEIAIRRLQLYPFLPTAFRRIIITAIVIELRRFYKHSLHNQWGFQEVTNTEFAIAFAVNTMRQRLPHAVILDLKKAYECVPRAVLQAMIDDAVPPQLSVM